MIEPERPSIAIPILESPRLLLRGHRLEDYANCTALWGDPRVTQYIGGKPLTAEEAWVRLLRYVGHWALLGFGYWVIEEKTTGTFLGEGGSRRDPLANPLHADLKGFPPIYIQTGADETLLDDSRKLADLARTSGVDVTLEIVPEMQHVFQFLAGTAPEGDAAIRRLGDWARPKLGLA